MTDLFDLLHGEIAILILSSWIIFAGFIVLMTYFFRDKNMLFKYISDFLISFSFVKRTNTILLSYASLLFIIGLVGLIFSLSQ